jgi:hypothetical protein
MMNLCPGKALPFGYHNASSFYLQMGIHYAKWQWGNDLINMKNWY